MRVWIQAVLFVTGVSLAPPLLARDGATMPTAPLRTYFEAERAAGAERSEPLARALLWTADHAPAARRDELLQLAAQADPAIADPHLLRAWAAVRRFDLAGTIAALGDAWHAVRLDAREEARWLRAVVRITHALLSATLFTLALLLMLRGMRLARHACGEAVGSRSAAAVLLVVPAVATFLVSPALGAILILLESSLFVRRREARTVGALCVLLGLVDVGMWFAAPHALLLDPRTRTAKIAHLNDAGHDAALERQLAALPRRSAEVELVLGLQARRRGDNHAAQSHFVAALRADSTNAAAYVNLANVFFRQGEYERAATGYRAAQALDPGQPLAYANLAQTYIRMTQYGESDRELHAAAERGMADISRRRGLWRSESQPILDATLSAPTLLRLAREELAAAPALRRSVLQTWRSTPWRALPAAAAAATMMLAGTLLLWAPRLRRVVLDCPECRMVLCAHCVAQSPLDDRCNTCQVTRPRPRVPGSEIVAPDKRRRISLASGRWVAPLFPGAADLVRGAPLAAVLAVTAAWIAIGAAAAAVDGARLRSEVWYVTANVRLLQAAAVGMGMLWLPGLLRLRGRERDARITRRAPGTGA